VITLPRDEKVCELVEKMVSLVRVLAVDMGGINYAVSFPTTPLGQGRVRHGAQNQNKRNQEVQSLRKDGEKRIKARKVF